VFDAYAATNNLVIVGSYPPGVDPRSVIRDAYHNRAGVVAHTWRSWGELVESEAFLFVAASLGVPTHVVSPPETWGLTCSDQQRAAIRYLLVSISATVNSTVAAIDHYDHLDGQPERAVMIRDALERVKRPYPNPWLTPNTIDRSTEAVLQWVAHFGHTVHPVYTGPLPNMPPQWRRINGPCPDAPQPDSGHGS
jgi:hypothetical protein